MESVSTSHAQSSYQEYGTATETIHYCCGCRRGSTCDRHARILLGRLRELTNTCVTIRDGHVTRERTAKIEDTVN